MLLRYQTHYVLLCDPDNIVEVKKNALFTETTSSFPHRSHHHHRDDRRRHRRHSYSRSRSSSRCCSASSCSSCYSFDDRSRRSYDSRERYRDRDMREPRTHRADEHYDYGWYSPSGTTSHRSRSRESCRSRRSRSRSTKSVNMILDDAPPSVPTSASTEANTDTTLNDSTLKLLGEEPVTKLVGPAIHKALVTRWSNGLKSQLEKKAKTALLKKYPVPSNCEALSPPVINPEVKSVLHRNALKRDLYNESRQTQLGAGITCLGSALTMLLNMDKSKPMTPESNDLLIETLGDAGRLLTDLFYDMFIMRRAYITPLLNFTTKSVSGSCSVDNFLFSKDFSEKYKTATAVEKNGEALAKPSSSHRHAHHDKSSFFPNNQQLNWPNNLNSKGTPKKYHHQPYQAQNLGGNQSHHSREKRHHGRQGRQHRSRR